MSTSEGLLEPAKDAALASVDDLCGAVREVLIGRGSSIEEEYRLTLQQAQVVVEGGTPEDDFVDFSSIHNLPPAIMAQVVLSKKDSGDGNVRRLRNIRMAGKRDVTLASTEQEIEDVVELVKLGLLEFTSELRGLGQL